MQRVFMRWLVAILVGSTGAAEAQSVGTVLRIGVLNDQNSVFADSTGKGGVIAAQMAAEDFGGTVAGARIEIVFADHQNKADIGSAIVRRWFDEGGVDAVADVGNSAVAGAVVDAAQARDKAVLLSGTGSTAFTGSACTPVTVQWTFDTWGNAHTIAMPLLAAGKDTWFFITVDYAFGHDLARSTRSIIEAKGGTVVGEVSHPINSADVASFVMQAQASKAKVIALANGGDDTKHAIKEARAFNMQASGQTVAALSAVINDVEAIGLEQAQGLLVPTAFYWDRTDESRAWSRRWAARNGGRMPSMMQAGVYSVVTAYLRAVSATKSVSGHVVVDEMKRKPVNDPLFGPVSIRADGRAVHDMYLWQVKTPAESTGPWDVFKLAATVPANEAFRPMSEGGCPLIPR